MRACPHQAARTNRASPRASALPNTLHAEPPLPGIISDSIFMRGVDDGGQVDVVLGEDGMHFRLPKDGDAIEQESL